MKKSLIKRVVAYVLLVFFLLGIIGYYYFDRIFFPIRFREIVLSQSEYLFNRKVTFDEMTYHLFEGLTITDIKVFDKESTSSFFLTISEVKAKVFLPALLNRKVLITSLDIAKPVIKLQHFNALNITKWNFSDLITLHSNKSPDSTDFKFTITNLKVRNAEIDYTDETEEEVLFENIKDVNILVQGNIRQTVKFKLFASIPDKDTVIKTNGILSIPDQALDAELEVNKINPKEYLIRLYRPVEITIPDGYVHSAQLKVKHTNSSLELSGAFNIEGGKLYHKARPLLEFQTCQSKSLHWKWDKKKNHHLKGQLNLTQLNVWWNDNFVRGTDISADAESMIINLPASIIAYKGDLTVSEPLMQLGPERLYKGDKFFFLKSSFTLNNQQVGLTGNFFGEKTIIEHENQFLVEGDFRLNDHSFAYRNKHLNFTGPIQVDYGHLAFANWSFDSNIITKETDLTFKDEIFTLKTEIEMDPLRIAAPNASNFDSDNLKMTIDTEINFPKETFFCQLNNLLIKDFLVKTEKQRINLEKIETDKTILTYKENELNLVTVLSPTNLQASFSNNQSLKCHIVPNAVTTHYDHLKRNIDIEGRLKMSDTLYDMGRNQNYTGNPSITFKYSKNIMHEGYHNYEVGAKMNDGYIRNVPILGDVTKIDGLLTLRPDGLRTEDLAIIALNTSFNISGSLRNFYEPDVDVNISAENIDLAEAANFVNTQFKKVPLELTGLASLAMYYRGLVKSPELAYINLTSKISDASVKLQNIPEPFTEINGDLVYKDYILYWDDLTCKFFDQNYTLKGDMSNFELPLVHMSISAPFAKLDTKMIIAEDMLQIARMKGTVYNSFIDMIGTLYFPKAKSFVFDSKGRFNIDAKDVVYLPEEIRQKILNYTPQGIIEGDYSFNGPFSNWKKCQIEINAKSDNLVTSNLDFQNVRFNGKIKNGYVPSCFFTSKLYDGEVYLETEMDLADPSIPIDADVKIHALDLAKWRRFSESKYKHLAGILNIQADIKGALNHKESLLGKGSIKIKDGYIWRWDVLDAISRAALIPDFQNDVITDGSADFLIEDGKITTQNMRLEGKRIKLKGEGWIDFEKNINFELSPAFSEIILQQSDSLRKIPSNIISQTDFLSIELTGSIDKIEKKINKNPGKMIRKTTENITGTIVDGVTTGLEIIQNITEGVINQNF